MRSGGGAGLYARICFAILERTPIFFSILFKLQSALKIRNEIALVKMSIIYRGFSNQTSGRKKMNVLEECLKRLNGLQMLDPLGAID